MPLEMEKHTHVCVRRLQTHDVRGVQVHLDDGPVHRPQQLLHQDLNVPLGPTLRTTNGFMFDLIFLIHLLLNKKFDDKTNCSDSF